MIRTSLIYIYHYHYTDEVNSLANILRSVMATASVLFFYFFCQLYLLSNCPVDRIKDRSILN